MKTKQLPLHSRPQVLKTAHALWPKLKLTFTLIVPRSPLLNTKLVAITLTRAQSQAETTAHPFTTMIVIKVMRKEAKKRNLTKLMARQAVSKVNLQNSKVEPVQQVSAHLKPKDWRRCWDLISYWPIKNGKKSVCRSHERVILRLNWVLKAVVRLQRWQPQLTQQGRLRFTDLWLSRPWPKKSLYKLLWVPQMTRTGC